MLIKMYQCILLIQISYIAALFQYVVQTPLCPMCTQTALQTTGYYTMFSRLLNAYENTQSAAENRNIPDWLGLLVHDSK